MCYTFRQPTRIRAVTPEGDDMVQKEKTERVTRIAGEEA
jgi:hypothetical protein